LSRSAIVFLRYSAQRVVRQLPDDPPTRSVFADQPMRSALATLATSLGCTLTILGEVAPIVLGAATAMAVLTTLPAGFGCPFPIMREVARTVLPANVTGAGGFLAVLCEVTGISCV